MFLYDTYLYLIEMKGLQNGKCVCSEATPYYLRSTETKLRTAGSKRRTSKLPVNLLRPVRRCSTAPSARPRACSQQTLEAGDGEVLRDLAARPTRATLATPGSSGGREGAGPAE